MGSYVTSPLIHEGHLYWVNDRGIAHCVDVKTGKVVFQKRLSGARQVYASAVLAAEKLYVVSREAGYFRLGGQVGVRTIGPQQTEVRFQHLQRQSSRIRREVTAPFQPISLQYRPGLIRLSSPWNKPSIVQVSTKSVHRSPNCGLPNRTLWGPIEA